SKEKSSCVKKWELSDVVGLRSSNLITRPWRMVLRGGAVATLSRASTRWVVVQFDCHPEASVLCAAKDLGEPREASRFLRRNNRAFCSLPYQAAPLPGIGDPEVQVERCGRMGLLTSGAKSVYRSAESAAPPNRRPS